MSFNDTEVSNFDSTPIALYEFYSTSGGVTNYWRYTSADDDQIVGSDTYTAIAISDAGITQDPSSTIASQFVVTMPVGADVSQMFLGVTLIPSDSMILNLWRYYPDGDKVLMWKGSIAGVLQQDALTAQVTCNQVSASFDRDGLRIGWTRGCPYSTYGVSCKVDPAAFTTTFIIDSISGNQIDSNTLADFVDDWFTGGYIEWVLSNGAIQRLEISDHAGVAITIQGITFGLSVGQTLKAIAGDDRTRETCNSKFNNLTNYGGFTDMPGKSPFDGDPVF